MSKTTKIPDIGAANAKPLAVLAKIISYFFHPLFIPVYIVIFLVYTVPFMFIGISSGARGFIILRFFIMYCFFPLITTVLAKQLGFVQSIYLHTQKERVIPYLACGIYFFWMAYVLRHQPAYAAEVVVLAIAIFVSSWLGLIGNIFIKISMHAMSMGVMVAFMFLIGYTQPLVNIGFIYLSILVAGLVLTSRYLASNHTAQEIYFGLMVGIASLLLAMLLHKILPN